MFDGEFYGWEVWEFGNDLKLLLLRSEANNLNSFRITHKKLIQSISVLIAVSVPITSALSWLFDGSA